METASLHHSLVSILLSSALPPTGMVVGYGSKKLAGKGGQLDGISIILLPDHSLAR